MDAPIFPLGSSAMPLNQLSRDFRNRLNKQLHSRNSSPAVLISPGLLSGSKTSKQSVAYRAPPPKNGDTGRAFNLQPSKCKTDLRTVIIIFTKAAGKKT